MLPNGLHKCIDFPDGILAFGAIIDASLGGVKTVLTITGVLMMDVDCCSHATIKVSEVGDFTTVTCDISLSRQ